MKYDATYSPLVSSVGLRSTNFRARASQEAEAACFHLDQERWYQGLDPRGQAIADMAVEGYSEEEMARKLGIARTTLRRCREALAQSAAPFLLDRGSA